MLGHAGFISSTGCLRHCSASLHEETLGIVLVNVQSPAVFGGRVYSEDQEKQDSRVTFKPTLGTHPRRVQTTPVKSSKSDAIQPKPVHVHTRKVPSPGSSPTNTIHAAVRHLCLRQFSVLQTSMLAKPKYSRRRLWTCACSW